MSGFLLVEIGCIECMNGSRVLGVYPTREAADAAIPDELREDAGYAPWIIDLGAVDERRARVEQ